MNIFILDNDPKKAAQYHCDKHVCKMTLESAQLLSTAHHVLDGERRARRVVPLILRPTHVNHPCAVWTRRGYENYNWLHQLMRGLLEEFKLRYGHPHTYEKLCDQLATVPEMIGVGQTPFEQCMPDEYKNPRSAVKAYRAYYFGDKQRMAQWRAPARVPLWWKQMEQNHVEA